MLRFLSRVPLRSGAWRVFVAPVAAVAAFTLPASKAAAQATVDQHVPTLPASKAAAQATVDQHVPFSEAVINPCTSELFSGSGFFHIKTVVTFTPNTHFSSELNVEDFKGATATGVTYVTTEESSFHTIFDTDVAPATQNQEFTEHFIRQGEDGTFIMGDDFYARVRDQLTINANGVVTVDNSEFTITCK